MWPAEIRKTWWDGALQVDHQGAAAHRSASLSAGLDLTAVILDRFLPRDCRNKHLRGTAARADVRVCNEPLSHDWQAMFLPLLLLLIRMIPVEAVSIYCPAYQSVLSESFAKRRFALCMREIWYSNGNAKGNKCFGSDVLGCSWPLNHFLLYFCNKYMVVLLVFFVRRHLTNLGRNPCLDN